MKIIRVILMAGIIATSILNIAMAQDGGGSTGSSGVNRGTDGLTGGVTGVTGSGIATYGTSETTGGAVGVTGAMGAGMATSQQYGVCICPADTGMRPPSTPYSITAFYGDENACKNACLSSRQYTPVECLNWCK